MLRGVKQTSEKLTTFDKQVVPGDLGKAVSGGGATVGLVSKPWSGAMKSHCGDEITESIILLSLL